MNLKNITPEEIKIIILISGVLIAGLVVIRQRGPDEAPVAVRSGAERAQAGDDAGPGVVVDIGGAVWRPGVYTLPAGARAGDALEKAMPRPDADLDRVNRAGVLHDGQKLIVPSVSDPAGAAPACSEPVPVNINSAGAAELQELPSIGERRARDIIDYRKRHGPFPSVDALENVPGIGPATVDRLRDRAVAR